MNKIAITGAHGSGKSTLITAILMKSGNFVSVADLGRLCPHPVGGKSTTFAQRWIIENQLIIEELLHTGTASVIFDNCSIGHLAYYIYWGGNKGDFIDRIFASSSRFKNIYLLQPNSSFLKDDGLRPTDVVFQLEIFSLQKEILHQSGLRYTVCDPTEGVELRPMFGLLSENLMEETNIFCAVMHENKYLLIRKDDDAEWKMPKAVSLNTIHWKLNIERSVLEQTGYLVSTIDSPLALKEINNCQVVTTYLKDQIKFLAPLDSAKTKEKWVPVNEIVDLLKC